ncbi:MAG: hypothetical protein KUG49_02105, partial [Dokdonia sp.]|nr:hypothetical protein [Dokdonia sp.]
METLIIIAKSAAILSLFYLTYRLVLQKDTFFSANRHYLIGGIIASLTLPFLQFTQTSFIDLPVYEAVPMSTQFSPVISKMIPVEPSFSINWWMVALVIYLVGVSIMFIRLGIQLASLHRLIQKHPKSKHGRYTFIEVYDDIAPFSFFQTIVYNPTVHTAGELEMILEHEKVHALQWHTIDVLLTQVTLAIQWANPLAWLYKESLEQNLEFIADSEAARAAASSTAYQRTLVKVSSTALRPALTNNFYHSLIKKRIVMLNKEASNKRNLWKLGLVLPILALFMYSFNVKEVVEYREVVAPSIDAGDPAFAKADVAEKESVLDPVIGNTSFTITEATSKEELELIENYFATQYANTQVKFTKVKHHDGHLSSFDFETKMATEKRFFTRFSILPNDKIFTPFNLIAVKEHEIAQVYENGNHVKFTPEESLTTFSQQTETEKMGKNPAVIINGKIITAPSTISFQSVSLDANIRSVLPSKAIALYGNEARDGALVVEDLNLTAQINGKYHQQPKAFVINDKTTDAQLRAMEGYFKTEYPEAIIEIYGVQRSTTGELVSYDVRTKFDKQEKWNQVLGVHKATSISQGMQVSAGRDSNGATIDLQELGPKGVLLRSTPSRLLIEDESLGKGLIGVNEGFKALSKDLNTMKEQMQQSFRIKITKNTTIEELKAIKASLKKDHNVDFDYSDVDFNSNNEITGMAIKYSTPNDNSGNYNVHGANGIADVYFYMEADGSVGLGNDESSEETRERMERRRGEMEERREELEVRAEERKEEMKVRRKEMRERMKEQEKMIEEQSKEVSTNYTNLNTGGRAHVKNSSLFIVSSNEGIEADANDGITAMQITKNTTDK